MKTNKDTPNIGSYIGSNIPCIFREAQDCNHPKELTRKERANTLYPFERGLNFNKKVFVLNKSWVNDMIGNSSLRFLLPSRVNIY